MRKGASAAMIVYRLSRTETGTAEVNVDGAKQEI